MKSSRPGDVRGAFTLIELLAVIAVIAILTAILIPVLGSAREQARMAACSSNLRQLGIGVQLYAAEHADTTPPFLHPASGHPVHNTGAFIADGRGFGALVHEEIGGPSQNNYIDSIEPLFCPSLPEEVFANDLYLRPEQITQADPVERIGYIWIYFPGSNIRDNSKVTTEFPRRPLAWDYGPGAYAFSEQLSLRSHEGGINVLHIGGHISRYSHADADRYHSYTELYDFFTRGQH